MSFTKPEQCKPSTPETRGDHRIRRMYGLGSLALIERGGSRAVGLSISFLALKAARMETWMSASFATTHLPSSRVSTSGRFSKQRTACLIVFALARRREVTSIHFGVGPSEPKNGYSSCCSKAVPRRTGSFVDDLKLHVQSLRC